MKKLLVLWLMTLAALQGKAQKLESEPIHFKKEKTLTNVRQLTFGGNNAEAYWSLNG